MIANAPLTGEVSPEYLDHLVAAADTQEVEATEDIVSGSGVKLLARGARIDAAMRERLLAHKLSRPLEQCIGISGGVTPEQIATQAEQLLDEQPLLAALAAEDRALPLVQSLPRLRISLALQSLLTLYARQQPDRLRHAVCVALIATSLARRLLPGDVDLHRRIGLAGLVHDVGELYLPPASLQRDVPLQVDQWRQIASHPVIGHRVLHALDGGGPELAELVLSHHERLDGFGYPRGLQGEQLGAAAQALATAEWLAGLIDQGQVASVHASIATKLIPGEFGDAVLGLLRQAARASGAPAQGPENRQTLTELLPQATFVMTVFASFRATRGSFDERLARASPELRTLVALGRQRLLQLQASFSSAGLDADSPEALMQSLGEDSCELQVELAALLREFHWRIREMERAVLLRAHPLDADDQALLQQMIATLKGALPAEA